jgi:hypothetical protein
MKKYKGSDCVTIYAKIIQNISLTDIDKIEKKYMK